MTKQTYGIGIYEDDHWVTVVVFRKRWHSFLFHWLLNKSFEHTGSVGR